MLRRITCLAGALCLILTACQPNVDYGAVHTGELPPPHVVTVERFIAAFNAHDSTAMGKFVADDIQWLSIAGEQVIVEAKGKIALVESMNAYFESCSTCRSELLNVASTPGRVSAIELASWKGKDGIRSQRAISVYEFSQGLINRVYYFGAEK
jgi:hypothetical protein